METPFSMYNNEEASSIAFQTLVITSKNLKLRIWPQHHHHHHHAFDLLSFLEVYLSWRSVANTICGNQPSLLVSSFLFFPNERHTTTDFCKLSLLITHHGRHYMYSSRGWLRSSSIDKIDELEYVDLQLFNPLSQAIINLPISSLPFSKAPFKFILSATPYGPNCRIQFHDGNISEQPISNSIMKGRTIRFVYMV